MWNNKKERKNPIIISDSWTVRERMEIKIPNRFEGKMGEDLCSECKSVYNKYEKFANSEMYFFPEYTDHSYKHIQYVLETANNLIPDDTFESLNSNDIFVLCLSILFHDLGMHITFKSLKSMYLLNPMDDFLEKSFVDLWKDYLDRNKINDELVGLENTNEESFKKHINDCAGFIREYHPMIANIIATIGFPIINSDNKAAVEGYGEKSKDFFYKLSGIVARSHGEDLRVMISYLEKHYGMMWKSPYDCHIVYLMCIVRIADYLHITDDRINPYRLNLLDFHSDKSKTEYLKHKSVQYSQRIYGNPETVYIEANPTDCRIFIELVDLLKCIQYELDTSWAVLGEVYDASALKLSIRRVTSNILAKQWQHKTDFVADKLKFHFDIRLVDLLIEPLYGKSASYGIRELIQNATDACKTRQALYCEEHYTPEVRINIYNKAGENNRCFSITDNGIGMSLDVIKNHFLNIGSKFRDSNEWIDLKELNEGQNEPAEKNGKFGVGILSSYLLGDNLKVKTCNIAEKIEYEFETRRDTQLIEVKKKQGENNYGTTIELDLKDDIDIQSLVIDQWYVSNDVNITITIFDKTMDRGKLINLDEEKGSGTEKSECKTEKIWKQLVLEKTDLEVYWSYNYKIPEMELQGKNDKSVSTYRPNLICNGIVIPKKYDEKNRNSIVSVWPTVYVIDRRGELELNLSRDEVNGNLPFIEELEAVLLQNFMERYRTLGEKNKFFSSGKMVLSQFNIDNYYSQKIMFGKKGYTLLNQFFLERLSGEMAIESDGQDQGGLIQNGCEKIVGRKKITVIRVWTRRNIEMTLDSMLDDHTYYIFEGMGDHPSLKYRITSYLRDVPFHRAIIYMSEKQFNDYQCYAANAYRLSQKFIESNIIRSYEECGGFCERVLKLNVRQEDISLAIVYSFDGNSGYSDGSQIFEGYFDEGKTVLQNY